MKPKLRHIRVEDTTYNYIVKNWGLKIFHGNFKNEFLKIDFEKDVSLESNLVFLGHLKVYKSGGEVILNMNQPGFVKEVIIALELKAFDFSVQKQYLITNGLELLEKMGYTLNANNDLE